MPFFGNSKNSTHGTKEQQLRFLASIPWIFPVRADCTRLAAHGDQVPVWVKCREKALRVEPIPGLANTVTDEDLVTVLSGALPWWSPPTVPSAFHELLLWRRNAVFTKEMLGTELTGESLLATLLSDKLCRVNTVSNGGTYMLDSPFGIRPVLSGTEDAVSYRAEAHYGQLLKLLAEVDVSRRPRLQQAPEELERFRTCIKMLCYVFHLRMN